MTERRSPRPNAHPVQLSVEERAELERLTSKGYAAARDFRRARVLLLLDAGWAPSDVPAAAGVSEATVRRVRKDWEEEGLEVAVYDRPRSGAPRRISAKQEAKIIAMVCSDPPEGRARWTLRLAAEEARRRGLVESVSYERVRVLLESHELKPWREKNVVRAGADE